MRIAAADACRVAGLRAPLGAGRSALLVHLGVVGQLGSARLADEPAQSVEKPPGSMSVTWMPNGSTSCASACEKPSSAHFDAW